MPSSRFGFISAVMRHPCWPWSSKWSLLKTSAMWALKDFRCTPELTVDELSAGLPACVRRELVEPLCVAALNTPAARASADVFLRVLQDVMTGARGSADLLLPRRSLGDLLAGPALEWLLARGATVKLRHRVRDLQPAQSGWVVEGHPVDHVILACTSSEAAKLTFHQNSAWSHQAQGLAHEAITTVYLKAPGARLRAPMVFLPEGPAQFAFDHGAMGLEKGRFAFVISAADAYRDQGREQLAQAVMHQAQTQFPTGTWLQPLSLEEIYSERRATFRCEPGVARPPVGIAARLWAAGDYVAGPYPATLEGAVVSGEAAVDELTRGAFAMQNRDSNRAKT